MRYLSAAGWSVLARDHSGLPTDQLFQIMLGEYAMALNRLCTEKFTIVTKGLSKISRDFQPLDFSFFYSTYLAPLILHIMPL